MGGCNTREVLSTRSPDASTTYGDRLKALVGGSPGCTEGVPRGHGAVSYPGDLPQTPSEEDNMAWPFGQKQPRIDKAGLCHHPAATEAEAEVRR